MSQEVHTVRRPFALLIGLFTVIGLVFAAAPAWAHDELIGSDPAAGAQVDALPAEITMTFSGVLMNEPGATDVVVTDAAGTDLTSGAPVIDGTRLTQALSASASGAASGVLTVIWRVVSSDGHPVSDQFTFTVGDGSAVAPAATPTPLPGAPMQTSDLTWVWIVLGIVLVGAAGAALAAFTRKARHSRED